MDGETEAEVVSDSSDHEWRRYFTVSSLSSGVHSSTHTILSSSRQGSGNTVIRWLENKVLSAVNLLRLIYKGGWELLST